MAAPAPVGAPPAKAVAFRELVERVAYAACGDTARSSIHGVWLEQETPESLLAVATDGHRLALTRGRFSFPLPVDRRGQGAFLRVDALKALTKLAPKRRRWWDLSTSIEGDDLVIRSEGGEVRASRVAEFPNWRQVKPNPKPADGYVLEPGAGAIVRELAVYAGERHCILVTVKPREAVLEVRHEGRVSVHGEARLRVTDWPLDAEALPPTVAVNADYLADALEHVSGAAALHVGGDDIYDPLTVVGPHGEAVVMPMRR